MKKMSNLIEQQAAIDVCNFFIDLWRGQLGEGISIAIKKRIADLPSAQLEIIRCKDCMCYDTYYRETESKPVITHVCKLCLDRTMEPDDFCSREERITDE